VIPGPEAKVRAPDNLLGETGWGDRTSKVADLLGWFQTEMNFFTIWVGLFSSSLFKSKPIRVRNLPEPKPFESNFRPA
jgi:hypothetical protein